MHFFQSMPHLINDAEVRGSLPCAELQLCPPPGLLNIEMHWDRQHCKADTRLLLIYCSKKQAICKHLYSYLWWAINGLRQASHLILKSWWAACCAHNSSSNPSLLRAGLVLYLSLSSSHLTRCLRQSRNPVNSHDIDIWISWRVVFLLIIFKWK